MTITRHNIFFSIQKKLKASKITIPSSSTGRFQGVLLNNQISELLPVRANVPQVPILGLHFFFFLLHKQDIYKTDT